MFAVCDKIEGMHRVVGAVLVVLALTGCAEKGDKPKGVATTSDPTQKRAPGEPARGGYVVMPSPEPTVLNPVLQKAFDLAHPLIFEGLIALDARLEPKPLLAELWTRSPDGKTLTFHLRKNVQWHDGKPFTAADVIFTIETIRSGKVPSLWTAYLSDIDKVEAVGDHTVKVTYKQTFGPDVASFIFGILPKHLYEGQDMLKTGNNLAVGTGPFKFTRWDARRSIILDANDKYWGGRPYLDKVELVLDLQANENMKALRADPGRVDFAQIMEPEAWAGELPTPEFRERFEVGTLEESLLMLISWNNQRKPFSDKNVRQALAMALDRPRVIEDVFKGTARPVSGPFYPTMWGADPGIAPWAFDLARAEQLLDAAGLPRKKDGKRFAITLMVEEDRRGADWFNDMSAIFRNDLDRIGVTLNVSFVPRGDLVDHLTLHDFDAVMFQFSADIPDPDPYALLHSTQVNDGQNYAGYISPEADKLLEEGRRTIDRSARKAAYAKLHKLVHEDQPYTFLFAPQSHYAWSRRVKGVSPVDVSSLPRWPGVARWWVER
jgi:peptide/nickel transport system substrate-binding protein